MGKESTFTAQKRAGALPTTVTANGGVRGRSPNVLPRGRQIQRTFNNVKITILCGFVTILVLRGTIDIGNVASSEAEAENQYLIEETNRILSDIRSDKDPDDPAADQPETFMSLNDTYSLGPKISNWDKDRKMWLQKNPEFPNLVNGKPRILLVTGSPPNPCDNAIGDHYLLKAIKNKIDYCRIHGIEIFYNLALLEKEMAGYWAKLPLIRRLMLSHPEVEWIWWMDSDALFTDMVFEMPLSKYNRHNLVIHGYPDLLFDQKSWIALNTGSFLFRNCQWSLDLLDAWAPMGPKGPIRDEAGKILTAYLKGRPAFEADDQSALIYLLVSHKDKWMPKVFVENSYYLHGYWAGLVDRYEEMIEKYHPGLGDERWPFVTHFVGCKPCGSYGDYPVERCLKSMERAFNFADNQVLNLYGFKHKGLLSPNVKRIRNETYQPLQYVDQLDVGHAKHKHTGTES
ncbi:probable xyloglucan 6-xylosyltransferase 5 [Solanum dulcamara]|uniref:probable xyloglucan 6-xylosyltransferase 5 n=1 Tax=Solanum dulcamara TaxID=45834 RepID=UPI00248614C8|nr:probable xyloglucan 6-xylosyltransferase 5 [Solanum dulcamara]XP_055815249.1 probable xyloglucan 6-xylosyltransferase 5 [Solanum dulcamara]XP_055815296.1 probable xyloglucan 6-xylosyltransferase 5 [Solanum dulcamara]